MFTIYKKELKQLFITPTGYVFTAIFMAVSALLFCLCTLYRNENSSIGLYFSLLFMAMAVMIPMLTMRLLSDEKRTKTDQLILTSPISVLSVMLGKYFAALTVFTSSLAVSNVVFYFVVNHYGSGNPGIFFSDVAGVFCAGAAFIAVGLFISSLTESMAVASLVSLLCTCGMLALSYVASTVQVTWLRVVIKWFAVYSRFDAFTHGMLDIGTIVYYLSLTAIFVFLTVRIYERRRWA